MILDSRMARLGRFMGYNSWDRVMWFVDPKQTVDSNVEKKAKLCHHLRLPKPQKRPKLPQNELTTRVVTTLTHKPN